MAKSMEAWTNREYAGNGLGRGAYSLCNGVQHRIVDFEVYN